jgi:hypothetical protein
MNQFPIAVGSSHVTSHQRPRNPVAIDARENPLLLHPYYHDPSKYLRFGEDGTIAPGPGEAEAMGAASIETYNLKRGSLDAPRNAYQTLAWNEVIFALVSGKPVPQVMAKYESGDSPYSAACLQYVKIKFERSKLEFRS